MLGNKSVVCVIPARLNSTRFPRKMLADLSGKPLLQRTYEAAQSVSLFDEVVVAVDSEELKKIVNEFGGKAFVTSPDCQSGTDRLVELQKKNFLQANIWVNWQGDEPFLTQDVIETLLQTANQPEEEIWTLMKKIEKDEALYSPHVVKVVCDVTGNALYFSRKSLSSFKHVGIYAFSDRALKKVSTLSPCHLEDEEKLEQLRFLFHGMKIRVHETEKEIFGIDTKEDLEIARSNMLSFLSS